MLEVATEFVVLNEIAKVVHEDNDVNTAGLGEPELVRVNAGIADCFPGRYRVRLASGVNRLLELVQMHVA